MVGRIMQLSFFFLKQINMGMGWKNHKVRQMETFA